MTGEEESALGIDGRPKGEIEERFLSPQADTFAGANVKEKASACSVRNDSFVAGTQVLTNDTFVPGLRGTRNDSFVAGPQVPTNDGVVAER